VGCRPNLHPAQYPDPGRLHQPDRPGLALAVPDHSAEGPVTRLGTLEVFLPDPPPTLVAVTPPAPTPEFPVDTVVHGREGASTHGEAVVQGPAFDLLVQTPDHIPHRSIPRVIDRCLDLG